MANGFDLERRFSRRSFIKIGALGVAGGAFLVACGDDDEGATTPAPTATTAAGSGSSSSNELKLIDGWYKDRAVEYYDFGANTKLTQGNSIGTAPIYVMITGMNADGTPRFVEGQRNIIGVKPGDQGYSDLWQVNLVTVPANYKANDLKSASAVMAANSALPRPTCS